MELKLLQWDKPIAPDEGMMRGELAREGYQIFKWADSAGTCYPPHQHDHHESIWVLEGQIEFQIGKNHYQVNPGDRLFLPSGTLHSAEVKGPQTCFYLVGEKD